MLKKPILSALVLLSTAGVTAAKPAEIAAHLLKPGVHTLAF